MTLITFCVQAQSAEVVSDAGIVESITLKNFMCHSLLGPFTFGSNVNFVVGNNGSECNLFKPARCFSRDWGCGKYSDISNPVAVTMATDALNLTQTCLMGG